VSDFYLEGVVRVGEGAFDVSLIATFHREGYIAGWTLDNLSRLRREADVAGLSHELICILDKADDETISVVEGHDGLRRQDKVARVDNGDPGMSRNDAVSRANGEFIAMFDGDDYHSRYWLNRAHRVLASGSRKRVVHPAFTVSFGSSHYIMKVLDQEACDISANSLLTLNPWGASVFVERRAVAECPYQAARTESTGFGHEDWHWNLEMIARGFTFVTAPETALYCRRRPNSRAARAAEAAAIVRPSVSFRQQLPGRSLA
jgi:glycosyltransferase involved in cell wall biosynthesis